MSRSAWRTVQLGELFTIKHGYAFKGTHFRSAGTHIVLTPGNFFDEGGFKHKGEKEKWYSGEVPPDYVLDRDDLLVAMTEQAEGLLGSSAIVPESNRYLHNQRLGLIQGFNGVDKHFLYYLFNSRGVRQQIRGSCSGVKVRHTSPSRIYEVKVDIPPISAQRKIAAILSAYDDLIENNQRRIRILEEMAQNLYREWFVKFRFPGHEQVPMVDSPLGKIPEGWEVVPVSEAVELNPTLRVEKHRQKTFVPMSGLSTDSMLITEYEFRTGNAGSKFQNGDTLFARITPSTEHGKTAFVQFLANDDEIAFGSTEFIVMRSRNLSPYYVYFLARDRELRETAIRSMTGASGRQRVQIECFSSFEIARPTADVLREFDVSVGPHFRLAQNLWEKNRALRQTRDLLLPKLISGELDVSNLDIDTGKAAA